MTERTERLRARAHARLRRIRRRKLEQHENDLMAAALLGSFVAGVVARYVTKTLAVPKPKPKPERRLRLVKGGRS